MGIKEALRARADIVKRVAGGDLDRSVLDFLPDEPPASVKRVILDLERELVGLVTDGGGPLTKAERVEVLEREWIIALGWSTGLAEKGAFVNLAERWNVTE